MNFTLRLVEPLITPFNANFNPLYPLGNSRGVYFVENEFAIEIDLSLSVSEKRCAIFSRDKTSRNERWRRFVLISKVSPECAEFIDDVRNRNCSHFRIITIARGN